MNERVENYLKSKKEAEQKKQAAYREKVLLAADLYKREYLEKEPDDVEWDDNLIWDSERQQYYKKVAIQVTDEEFAEIEKYSTEKAPEEEERGMFANIGSKIMGLAQFECWLGIIACIISGLVMIVSDSDMIGYGLLIMAGGSLASWVGSWLIYAFGELLETVKQIERNTRKS